MQGKAYSHSFSFYMETTQKKDQNKSTPIICCNTKKNSLIAQVE